MDHKRFFDKVVEMREAQKEYFRTRGKEALVRSKQAESEIDREIERVEAILAADAAKTYISDNGRQV